MTKTLVQNVSTGDVVVFDKESRELIIVHHTHTLEWNQQEDKSFAAAEKFVADNKAKKFSRSDLQSIQAALAGVVLLV